MALPPRTPAGRVAAGLLLAGLIPTLAGCSDDAPEPEQATAPSPDTADDNAEADPGRALRAANGEVLVPTQPERVVALSPPTLSALIELGHQPVAAAGDPDEIDAVLPDQFDREAFEVLPPVAELTDDDLPRLSETEPDLIVGPMTARDFPLDLLASLSRTAPTALFAWEGSGSWQDHAAGIAEAVGAGPALEEVEATYSDHAAEVRTALEDAGGHSGAVALAIGEDGDLQVNTAGSMAGKVLEAVGFDPLVDDTAEDWLPLADVELTGAEVDHVFVLADTVSANAHAAALDDAAIADIRQAWPDASMHTVDPAHWDAGSYASAHRMLDDIDEMVAGG